MEITKKFVSWEEWYAELRKVATQKGGSAADAEAWREDYDAGRTPEQAWFEAWGE